MHAIINRLGFRPDADWAELVQPFPHAFLHTRPCVVMAHELDAQVVLSQPGMHAFKIDVSLSASHARACATGSVCVSVSSIACLRDVARAPPMAWKMRQTMSAGMKIQYKRLDRKRESSGAK